MTTSFTSAGEALIALHHSNQTSLKVDKIIVANMTGLDHTQPVNKAEGMPASEDIVHTYVIPPEYAGYVNPNQVVYSMLLTSDQGNFSFNWMGLYSSEDDIIVAITYLPTTDKWKTNAAEKLMGNNLTRNFMLEFADAQAVTNITVEAATWQIDFTARLKGIDERERLSNRDVYGRACFFGNSHLVVNNAGTFKIQPGIGYVEGIRLTLNAEQIINPGALPASVYLDVALQAQGSDRVAVVDIVFTAPGDYTDEAQNEHYSVKIADIASNGTVTDTRRTEAIIVDLIEFIKSMKAVGIDGVEGLQEALDAKAPQHSHPYAAEDHTHTTIETDYISGAAMTPPIGSKAKGRDFEFGSRVHQGIAFPHGQDSWAEFEYPMPESWNRGTIKAKMLWAPASNASVGETVTLGLKATSLSNGDPMNLSITGARAITDSVVGGTNLHLSAASQEILVQGSPALGDLLKFAIFRDISADTLPVDMVLLGIWIQYTCSKTVAAW